MGNDMRRDIGDRLAGEWIFLAQAVGGRQSDAFGNFRTQSMPVMNCRRGNRTFAPLQRPPYVGQLPSPRCP
jgi:hypothetical protein